MQTWQWLNFRNQKRGKRNFLSGANFDALGVIYPAASFTAEIGKTLNTNPPYNFPFVSVEYLLNKITDGYTQTQYQDRHRKNGGWLRN